MPSAPSWTADYPPNRRRHMSAFRPLLVLCCISVGWLQICTAMESIARESAFEFATRIFSDVDKKDASWLVSNAVTVEGPGKQEELVTVASEWLNHQKKFGWKLTVLSEHGDALKKMIVLRQGDHNDPLFIVRENVDSPWKMIFISSDEDVLVGKDSVTALREVFKVVDMNFRKK